MAHVELAGGSELVLRDDVWDHINTPTERVVPQRLAFAAAHVVMKDEYCAMPHSRNEPGSPDEIASHIDWDQTFSIRKQLASYGLGIAEAMDTAQRFEIGWPAARHLIEQCAQHAGSLGFIAGAGTDHRAKITGPTELIDAVCEQIAIIRASGGTAIVLPMPWLSLNNCDEETYVDVYRAIAANAGGTLLVHWLGEMFLPSMRGYFPGRSFDCVMAERSDVYRGAKLSLLDADQEEQIRRALEKQAQVILTGDDFHFGRLIIGDGAAATKFMDLDNRQCALVDGSHALLGILDGVAAPASLALQCLRHGQVEHAREILSRCERVGKIVFEAPTDRYKVGLAFLSWLNGWQRSFMLPNHLETTRDKSHLIEVVRAANNAGAITNPAMAAERFGQWLTG